MYVAQWWSMCLTCARFWVGPETPRQRKKSKGKRPLGIYVTAEWYVLTAGWSAHFMKGDDSGLLQPSLQNHSVCLSASLSVHLPVCFSTKI